MNKHALGQDDQLVLLMTNEEEANVSRPLHLMRNPRLHFQVIGVFYKLLLGEQILGKFWRKCKPKT